MIPKVIHYCWFGQGEKTAKIKKCIESWKKYCPQYQIVEWNEKNFDVNIVAYTKKMYNEKKYAFLSDYVRLYIICNYGGIYLDTDVEVIKSFDPLLETEGFIGFENDKFINTGLGFGAEKGHPAVLAMLREYDYFPEQYDDKLGPKGCPVLNTEALEKLGLKKNGLLQQVAGITVYPESHFNPYNSITGEINIANNTYSIHWYAGSWMPSHARYRHKIGKQIKKLIKKIQGVTK